MTEGHKQLTNEPSTTEFLAPTVRSRGFFCTQHDGEAQGCFECKQMPTAIPCILLAGLLEWREPAGLIKWRVEQAEEAEGNDDIVAIEDFSTPLVVGANKEDAEDAEGKAESDVVEIVGGTEVLEPDAVVEGAEANSDSDVVEVTWVIKSSEAIEGMEDTAAEW